MVFPYPTSHIRMAYSCRRYPPRFPGTGLNVNWGTSARSNPWIIIVFIFWREKNGFSFFLFYLIPIRSLIIKKKQYNILLSLQQCPQTTFKTQSISLILTVHINAITAILRDSASCRFINNNNELIERFLEKKKIPKNSSRRQTKRRTNTHPVNILKHIIVANKTEYKMCRKRCCSLLDVNNHRLSLCVCGVYRPH